MKHLKLTETPDILSFKYTASQFNSSLNRKEAERGPTLELFYNRMVWSAVGR